MTRIVAIVTALCLAGFAAATEPLLPRCTADLAGQVSEGGCSCDYDRGGQLVGHPAGWRWTCDLLRGPGPTAPISPAGLPPPGLPNGFVYAPQTSTGANDGSASTPSTPTLGTTPTTVPMRNPSTPYTASSFGSPTYYGGRSMHY